MFIEISRPEYIIILINYITILELRYIWWESIPLQNDNSIQIPFLQEHHHHP